MKKLIIFAVFALVAFTLWYYRQHPLSTRVKIRDHVFLVDVAVTPEDKERGLAYRDFLASDRGMLFIYDHKGQYDFWMKGMRFPLDFVWLDDKRVVDITANVPVAANGTLPAYHPKVPVNQVLEVPAGTIENIGITIGDTLEVLR